MRYLAVLTVVQLVWALPATADLGGEGEIAPELEGGAVLSVGLVVAVPGDGGVYTGSGGPASPSPVRFVSFPVSEGEGLSVTYLCAADGVGVVDGEPPWGWVFIVAGYDTVTGEEVSRSTVCVPVADPASPAVPPAPAAPVPPSIVEIWESVGIAGPEVHVSPAGEGVTGLETWVWSGGATSAVVDATIGAWTVTGSASLVAWSVDPGDGTGAHATDHPGDAEDHALDHDYEIKGTYPLSVTAVWTADVTLSGPGLPPVPVSIGTALLTSTRQYRVVEVVPVLLP